MAKVMLMEKVMNRIVQPKKDSKGLPKGISKLKQWTSEYNVDANDPKAILTSHGCCET